MQRLRTTRPPCCCRTLPLSCFHEISDVETLALGSSGSSGTKSAETVSWVSPSAADGLGRPSPFKVGAEVPLVVAAGDVGADGGPERAGFPEVAAEGVPRQAGVFSSQRGQAGRGQAAALEARLGEGLFDPSE